MNQLAVISPSNNSNEESSFLRSLQMKASPSEIAEPARFLEFFAGSGLVAEGLNGYFRPAWANDICAKKAKVYVANHGDKHFCLGSISDVKGAELPVTPLAWASFPCQDLSLAGLTEGIYASRSGSMHSIGRKCTRIMHLFRTVARS